MVSIDGTDISGVTIDGTDVQEITIDGNVAWTSVPSSGVSRWTLDNADVSGSTVTDVWGNNDGTNDGATTTLPGANQTYNTNESFEVDGSNGKTVNCGEITGPQGSTDFTLAAWIKKTASWSSGFNSIIATHENNDNGWGIFSQTGDTISFRMEQSGSKADTNSVTISDNQWYHVVGVFNNNSSVLYLDGGQAAGNNNTSDINVPSVNTPFKMGNDLYKTSRQKTVQVDDVRIYDRDLSSSEVSNLYSNGAI